jgi:hypothetical protein
MTDERKGVISGSLFWLLDDLQWGSEISNEVKQDDDGHVLSWGFPGG